MNRLAKLMPAALTPEQAALYATITAGPRARGGHFALADEEGGLNGPFNAMLLAPAIGQALQDLGAALRYRGSLSDRSREIVILLVAVHTGSRFETQAHEAVGRAVGLDDDELLAIRSGKAVGRDAVELAVIGVATALLERGNLSDQEYADAASTIGADALFEIACLVGYYSTLAMQMRLFGVE